MPAKNSLKLYEENSYYHLYNRGVEKRAIFLDDQDSAVFLSYLKEYLSPKDTAALSRTISSPESDRRQKQKALNALRMNNFFDEIHLLSYALMSNHYHFLVSQRNERSIDRFLNSLGTRYTMYFNKKYKRVGKLYQGVYKAVKIKTDEQLLHVSRYIHLNPLSKFGLSIKHWQETKVPSSLPEYLGTKNTNWIETSQILSYFNKTDPQNSYRDFMGLPINAELVAPVSLDFDDE